MQRVVRTIVVSLLALTVLAPATPAEVVEEIVALVDGDILTKSEFDQEEQTMVQEIYRRFTGDELDEAVESLGQSLLIDLIDRRILVHRAERMFDTATMGDVFYRSFREQQNVTDEEQFVAMLAREGMTVESLKTRLINMFAPDEVVRFEVSSRISVADREVEAYYAAHNDEFRYDDEVQLREIVLLADSDAARAARREAAEQLHASLTGESFATVATASSDAGTKESGGLLGLVKRGDLSEELERIAFALPAGTISELLEMPYGFHILFAESSQVGEMKTLEQVRDELRGRLEDDRFAERMKEFMVKARNESEWCIKAKFIDSVPAKHGTKVCKEM